MLIKGVNTGQRERFQEVPCVKKFKPLAVEVSAFINMDQ